MIKTNIEEYIKKLSGKVNTCKISVVLYDEANNIYHYIYKIKRNINECEMISVNYESIEDFDISLPFINQLNQYYNHCRILTDDSHIGQNARSLCNRFNQRIDKRLHS